MQFLGVKRHRAALQDRTEVVTCGVLAGARSPTVEIQRRFEFPQTVVDAKDKSWPEPPAHQLALAAPDLVGRSQGELMGRRFRRSEEHTSEIQSQSNLVFPPLAGKKKNKMRNA